MDSRYNLNNFEASFRQYLVAENHSPVSIKNYLSDLRHFVGWMDKEFRIQNLEFRIENISTSVIEAYKTYLSDNQIPLKTINRRLSTLRKFCSFCISQGWMKENPAKQVKNIGPIDPLGPISLIQVLTEYEQYLAEQNFDQKTITSYLNDVEEFYQFVQSGQ